MNTNNKWIIKPNPRRDAKLRLFCFPYAGSSAVVTYKYYADNLPEFVEVCPVELPGRGARMIETQIDNLEHIVAEITKAIKDHLDIPFAFFGHSMGALICYELAYTIFEKYGLKPFKLYLSAHKAPFLERTGPVMHRLNSDEFISELIKMDGISKEILEHKELMELMLPIIKNDYKVCETYKYAEKVQLDIPITVFGGTDDKDISEEDLIKWNGVSNSDFNHFLIHGDHFFIVKEKEKFINLFSNLLINDISKFI